MTPSVSLGSMGQVRVNFGRSAFAFDIEARMDEWQRQRQAAIDEVYTRALLFASSHLSASHAS